MSTSKILVVVALSVMITFAAAVQPNRAENTFYGVRLQEFPYTSHTINEPVCSEFRACEK